jgi:hypothetical protein
MHLPTGMEGFNIINKMMQALRGYLINLTISNLPDSVIPSDNPLDSNI